MNNIQTEIVSSNLELTFTSGEINIYNTNEIEKFFLDFDKKNGEKYDTVTFNLKNVETVDSSAMGFMVRTHLYLARRKKDFVLANLTPRVKETFENTKLDRDFTIV
jgi:anti-anti-sigma factor